MKYVGFYWTLSAGWLGLRDLGKTVSEAERKSKTIRYQRKAVQYWIRRQNEFGSSNDSQHQLVHEVTYIDKRPDRPTHGLLLDAMKHAGQDAIRRGAALVIVEFGSSHHQMRRIRGLRHELNEAKIPVELLPAEEMEIDGKPFAPEEHFLSWKKVEAETKLAVLRKAVLGLAEAIKAHGAEGEHRYDDIAHWLNSREIWTPTGRRWSAENVRKVIKRGTWQSMATAQS